MDTTKVMIATPFIEACAIEDDNDELCGMLMSDEEILRSFLKEGCDLDGSPLRMVAQPEPGPETPYQNRTLH
jgi:hypothetical protein